MKGFAKVLLILVGVTVVSCFALALLVPKASPTVTPRLAVTIFAPQHTAAPTFTPEPPPTATPTIEPTVEGQPLTESQYTALMQELGGRAVVEINELDSLRGQIETVGGRLRLANVSITMQSLAADYRKAIPPPRYAAAHEYVLAVADDLDACANALANQRYPDAFEQLAVIGVSARAAAAEFEKVE